MNGADTSREPIPWLARLLLGMLVVVVVAWVVRRTTWYLAVDQFGYLTFARDLVHGRVAHDWALLPLLAKFIPPGFQADVLGQTYVYDDGALYCRYAPGFPLVLAAVSLAFGAEATHLVNPVAMGVLLATLFWVARRATESDWIALAVPLLVTLLPTYVLLWSISPLRDVPAHIAALLGLGLLVPTPAARASAGRWAGAGLLLGFAVSTRIDAVLYGVPTLGLAFFWRPWRRSHVAAALAAALLGVLPLLAYNAIATGNPLRPTQAMELNQVLSDAGPAPSPGVVDALAGLVSPVDAYAEGEPQETRAERRARRLLQGGGIRFEHLTRTLPANLEVYAATFGPLGLGLALVGALAALRRPPLFVLSVPYVVVATLFFSLWPRPDTRYLAGAILMLTVLLAYGGAVLARAPGWLRDRGLGRAACLGGVVLAAIGVFWWVGLPDLAEPSARPYVTIGLGASLALAWLVGVFAPHRAAPVFPIVLCLGLASVVGWRSVENLGRRGSFQEAQVEIARATVEGVVGERAVIFTSTDVGRPGENINFYTHATAVYLRELARWDVTPGYMLDTVLGAGFEAYLLLRPVTARKWIESRYVYPWFRPELVAEIPATEARRWFVASAFHQGVDLWLVRMHRRDEPLPLD